MSLRGVTVVAVLWVLSLFAVGTIVYGQVYAINPVTPHVVAGPNFGIRIEGEQNGVPVGMPVVQIDGKWVTVTFGTADGKTNLKR
jgi:hypothetical protein